MTIVMMDREQEKLEFESLPEYIRESQAAGRETSTFAKPTSFVEREPAPKPIFEGEKSDELEALWPGVHQDFVEHGHRRAPSFFLMLGFMAGAVVSLIGVWGYSAVSHQLVAMKDSSKKEVVVAGNVAPKGQAAPGQATTADASSNETLIPLTSVYEVQNGDTLAAIAYRNYKRVSPRLMDEICKANGMRNANVLSLGQKITLPEYHSQVSQIAATAAGQPQ